MALTFTQTDLDNLKAALVTGAMEVRVGDRTIKYRSQKEILDAIRLVQLMMDGAPDDDPNVVQATFSKGSE